MKIIISLIFTFALNYFSYAQDTLFLNLEEALNIALENNINLKQQENLLKTTKANILQSLGSYLPNFNISSSNKNTFAVHPDNSSQSHQEMGYSLNSNYTIFNGFERLNNLLQSFQLNNAQLSIIEQTKQNVIFLIATQYLQVLLDQEIIKITIENLKAQNTSLEQLKGYVEAGITSNASLYILEAQISLIEVQLLNNKNQLFSDKTALAATLMVDLDIKLELSIPDWGIEKILAENYDILSLWDIAKINRPDIKQLEQTTQASLYNIKIARSSIYPKVDLFYNYSSSYSYFKNIPLKDQLAISNPFNIVGVNLSIPIFNNFQYHAIFTSAKVNYENNLLNYENSLNIVYSQLVTVNNKFLTTKETYKASLASNLATKISFELQTERFNLGIGNIVELSLASQNYRQAQATTTQAEYTLLFQKIIIDYYTGVLQINSLY